MKIIKGFQQAKTVLSRQTPAEPAFSVKLKQRLMTMFGTDQPEQVVRQILDDVRQLGDSALFQYTQQIDSISIKSLEVDKQQINDARRNIDRKLLAALELAAERIRSFHEKQKRNIWHEIADPDLRQMIRPLQRVGVYVPGGTASYPSTVLMTAVPAKVAGVGEIILVTPPGRDGEIPPITLAAASLAQVDRIFRIGGAQAIGALAYGTDTIPRVDKICGPGNIFVMLAKKLVYGTVAIDGLQGPSEVVIVTDETASAEYCAADLLAQAEHDPLASATLITTSPAFADEVDKEVRQQLKSLSRKDITAESLEHNGTIAVVDTLDEALELVNLYAPEHLSLMFDGAESYVDKVANAGCVFIGGQSPVVLGDYVAGPSHVLPTGGTARFSSPLTVADFLKFINVVRIGTAEVQKLADAAATIAEAEGLEAHARAAQKRINPRQPR